MLQDLVSRWLLRLTSRTSSRKFSFSLDGHDPGHCWFRNGGRRNHQWRRRCRQARIQAPAPCSQARRKRTPVVIINGIQAPHIWRHTNLDLVDVMISGEVLDLARLLVNRTTHINTYRVLLKRHRVVRIDHLCNRHKRLADFGHSKVHLLRRLRGCRPARDRPRAFISNLGASHRAIRRTRSALRRLSQRIVRVPSARDH